MANQITKDGITIRSLEEIKDLIINGDDETPGLQQIYGEDAVFDSDSPDGQLVGIFAQAIRDVEELVLQVYSSFDPDQAIGVSLDNRVLYNGLRRKGGTYTITPVSITTGNSEVSLKGLNETDAYSGNLFTVFDNTGNEYYLINSHTIPANTTQVLSFRAKQIGQVQVTPNTITKSKTLINTIKSINNNLINKITTKKHITSKDQFVKTIQDFQFPAEDINKINKLIDLYIEQLRQLRNMSLSSTVPKKTPPEMIVPYCIRMVDMRTLYVKSIINIMLLIYTKKLESFNMYSLSENSHLAKLSVTQ